MSNTGTSKKWQNADHYFIHTASAANKYSFATLLTSYHFEAGYTRAAAAHS